MAGITAAGVFETVCLGFLGIAAWQDKRSLSISKRFLFFTGIFAVLGRCLVDRQATWVEWGLSVLPGMIFWGFGWLSRWQIGMGDVAVVLVMGIWLGYEKTFVIVFVGMFLCSIFCGGLVLFRKAGRKTEVPFVPFLLIGYLIGRILV